MPFDPFFLACAPIALFLGGDCLALLAPDFFHHESNPVPHCFVLAVMSRSRSTDA